MKKVFAILALTAFMTSCGGGSTEETTEATATDSTTMEAPAAVDTTAAAPVDTTAAAPATDSAAGGK